MKLITIHAILFHAILLCTQACHGTDGSIKTPRLITTGKLKLGKIQNHYVIPNSIVLQCVRAVYCSVLWQCPPPPPILETLPLPLTTVVLCGSAPPPYWRPHLLPTLLYISRFNVLDVY